MKYPKLFSPYRIGNVEIRNRVVVTPMGTGLPAVSGAPSQEYIAYVQERAKGGLGLFITEVVGIDEEYGRSAPRQLWATNFNQVNEWRRLADAVHMYGGKLFAQLQHPGRQTPPAFNPTGITLGAGDKAGVRYPIPPRMLTKEEIDGLVAKFAKGAQLLQMAGLDGVELHAAHSYLIHQFMSSMINNRTDEYGGSFENRMRFVTEIVAAIREACGPAFPISVRISATENYPGGYELDEGVRIAQYLEGIGVDAINVSNGIAESGYMIQEPPPYDEGWKIGNAREIKKHVKLPVIAVSQIRRPAYAESLIEDGSTDFVGISRGHLADPHWCSKAQSGNEADIRPCVSCLYCFNEIVQFKGIRCAVNAQTGRELELPTPTADTGHGRHVAIIGAGPTGLEAARVAAQKGYRPVVFERTGQLGGMLHQANKLLHKYRIDWLVDNLIYQTQKAGVEFRLNTEATLPVLKALDPALVIVATGSKPIEVPFPGSDGANVYPVTAYLKGDLQFSGKKVAVIGGGTTGCEVAEKLATEGNDVTVVEMRADVGLDMFPIPRMDFMPRMDNLGIKKLVNTKLEKITAKGIVCEDLTSGKKVEADFDAVIMSLGYQPDNNTTQMVKDNFENVRVVGDAVKVRKIAEAIFEGHAAAWTLP